MQLKKIFPPILAFAAAAVQAQEMSVAPDHSNGVYEAGQTVHWRVEWKGGGAAPVAHCKLLAGGLTETSHGDLVFSNNVATFASRFDAPGTLLAEVKWADDNPSHRATAGAVAAPGKISLSASCPKDFGKFWKSKLKELEKIPANPKLESVEIGKTNLSYWKITMDNIRGSKIHGQLARPVAGEKFPALLIVQWAGVYGLQQNWVTDRANEGFLALDIEPHDLPIDEPESFYKDQFAGPLKDYWSMGNDDRETSYYLRMYLSCYRAAEYLTRRRDWNGKTLVVMGDSQGGMQALMLAGLFSKKITAAIALVPAGCDMLGPGVGRAGGWPNWYFNTGGKDPKKVREASRYFDVANFTPRIRCPVIVGLGLRDEVCPPAGVLAAFNEIKSPKELVILPKSGHQDEHGTQAAFNQRRYSAWLPALAHDRPVPVPRN